ncbi:CubicO group peptidase (beta-lactamase class C family) [Curtobacterium sp. PhB130]|uniref:serine hydrolase domain-containing protein n=1 Tax=Curtobacterium sp. PhB130 TaxID=2485178 RepID=UPI000F4B07E4|nr:serine hydrolase domain-containing protein [Curtobacterium sp. PhB130]ROS76188.1 CubicO group peptidase (beta-lactamase class C family) [Curtobacterium sp. PhB130]
MTTTSPETIARIDELFRERVERGVAPSTVWGVFDADGLVASGGHGDRGDGRAPDADTVYRIASCTKSITAATLLTLVAAGRVSLDAPITDFVPAFADVALPTPDAPIPTLRMLLTMSAGFPTDDPWGDRQESISDDELDAVLRAGLLFDSVPGTGFAYSNLGYALLGRAVAVVAGRPFVEVAHDVVLEPLGLDDTVFAAADARGYVVTGARPFEGTWEPLPLSGPGAFSPIGGLFSTVTDLARWARHLSSAFAPLRAPGSVAEDGPVSPADRRLMQQAMRVIPTTVPGSGRPVGYGFGLFVEQDAMYGPIASHSGGYPGFSAHMRWSVRSGLGVVAFENATQAKVSVATEAAHDLLLAADVRTRPAPVSVLPETRAAQAAVSRLLAGWSDDLADAICTPNVAMDVPYDRRRAAIAAAAAAVGADLGAAPVAEASTTPTHLRWWLPGTAGRLRVEIRLAPLASGRVQTLICTAEPVEAEG